MVDKLVSVNYTDYEVWLIKHYGRGKLLAAKGSKVSQERYEEIRAIIADLKLMDKYQSEQIASLS